MPQPKSNKRRPLMAANWKMYKTPRETEEFLRVFLPQIPSGLACDIVICPPFVDLPAAAALLSGSPVGLGAQNLNENAEGAYTGEISGAMLAAAGCRFVVIGHSERRQLFGETDDRVNKKIQAALKNGLTPIVCVGETLSERESNQTIKVVERQVKGALENLPSAEVSRLILAYEPIWAIGTGKTATPAQAQEVHLAIRDILKDQYGSLISLGVRILYGGSIKPENISELMQCEDIDGGLVGGASLKPESFLSIVNFDSKRLAPR